MAKRFTDNEKWKKQFFKGLSTVNKLFFLYIVDECDHAGIWHVENEVAEIRIGEKINIDTAKKEFGKHIKVFDNGEKWFIPSFVEFQYGKLNEKVNAHKSVIRKLKSKGLYKKYQLFINCSSTDQDKDMDKDMDKDINIPFEKFWNLYDYKVGKDDAKSYWLGKKKLKNGKYLSDNDRMSIINYLPEYVRLTHKDGTFPSRKHPKTFLYQSGWCDELPKQKEEQPICSLR